MHLWSSMWGTRRLEHVVWYPETLAKISRRLSRQLAQWARSPWSAPYLTSCDDSQHGVQTDRPDVLNLGSKAGVPRTLTVVMDESMWSPVPCDLFPSSRTCFTAPSPTAARGIHVRFALDNGTATDNVVNDDRRE